MNNGMVPIIAYNYGACKPARIKKTIKLAMTYAEIIMLIGFAAFHVIPGPLLSMFSASEQMMTLGIPALKILSWSYLVAGLCIIASSVFQALGNGVYSLLVSFGRQLVVLLPGSISAVSDRKCSDGVVVVPDCRNRIAWPVRTVYAAHQ